MRNRDRRTLSFRTRLTLQWTAAFGLLITVALVGVHAGARTYGYHELDLHLRTVAATELASSTDQGAPIHLHDFPASALNRSEFAPKFTQVYTTDGRVLLQKGALATAEPLIDAATLAAAFAGEAPLVEIRHDGVRGRMVALRTIDDSGNVYVLAVGMLTTQVDAALARLAWMLGIIWVAALVATGALGHALASRALEPIDRITARAASIARDQINARLDPPRVDDEIGRMTELLNAMLDRLHEVIDANRHFAADASHELRSPLTAIAGEIDVALTRERDAEEYRDTLLIIRQRVNEMFTLADDLTLLVRAERGVAESGIREVRVGALLQGCRERLEHLSTERGVKVRIIESAPDLVVFGDPRLLARAVENVVANAVQHSAPGGNVVVEPHYTPAAEGAWEPDCVRVRVADQGPGIPEHEWERVFDRFYRRDSSRSRRTGGTGLGLAICRAIVTLFGGSVRVLASSPSGSVFELTLQGGEAGQWPVQPASITADRDRLPILSPHADATT
jgi:two-component system OmpR family sensor kinase